MNLLSMRKEVVLLRESPKERRCGMEQDDFCLNYRQKLYPVLSATRSAIFAFGGRLCRPSVRSSNPRSPHLLLSCPVLSRPSELQQPLSVNEISSRPPTFHSLTHSKFSKFLSRAGRTDGRQDGMVAHSHIHRQGVELSDVRKCYR